MMMPWGHGYMASTSSVDGTELVYDTAYAARARDRLLSQFHGKPRLEAFVSACVAPFQELELAAWQLVAERTVDTALAHALRVLAHLVGIRGFDAALDSLLRRFVRAAILARRSGGDGDALLDVARVFSRSSALTLRAYYPACVIIRLGEPLDADGHEAAILGLLVRRAALAGVRVIVEVPVLEAARTFRFSTDLADDELSDDVGFADDDETIGGSFVFGTTGDEP